MEMDYRRLSADEVEAAIAMERACFPEGEQVPKEAVRDTILAASDSTLGAFDKASGTLAGMILGLSTDEDHYRDEFVTDLSLHDPAGTYLMITGVEVLPEYRHQGIASELMSRHLALGKARGQKAAILTCLEELVPFYAKMGFVDLGISGSSWAGEEWHEMKQEL